MTGKAYPIQHGLYFLVGHVEDGRLIAVCSDGTPQHGHDPVTVLTLEVVPSVAAAKAWFGKVRKERPWEPRQ